MHYLSGLNPLLFMKSCTFYLLSILSSFFYHSGSAQDYLLTAKGDSLSGDIKPLSFGVDKKVQIAEEGKKKAVYSIFQVKEYRFKGDIFRPVKGPSGYTFMKLVKDGYLSLYFFQAANQATYDGLFLLKRDGSGIEVPNLGFKKAMKKFLDDCNVVANKIDADELNKKDLHAIIDQYNACITNYTSVAEKVVTTKKEVVQKSPAWDTLEEKVKAQPEFEGKQNALEMIGEIKAKIASGQKIPNFLISGLQSSLNQDVFKTELENALKETAP
jgi:hypothetical protein